MKFIKYIVFAVAFIPLAGLAQQESDDIRAGNKLYKDKKYLFFSFNEILNMVSIEIIKHYIFNDGKASIWGKIENYQLHLFGEIYTFDTKGNILDTNENFDTNIASLK